MLLIVFQMVRCNAEYLGGKYTFPFVRGQVRYDFQQNILSGILGIRESVEHMQRQVKHQILYTKNNGFQRFLISGSGFFN